MVVTGVNWSLFNEFCIPSTDIVFDKDGTGKISNSGYEDTRVFLKHLVQLVTLVGEKVTLGKAFR